MFSETAPREMGTLIRRVRRDAGLTQAALAEKLGYSSPQFISNWERGESLPPVEALPKIAVLTRTKYSQFAGVLRRDFDRVLRKAARKTKTVETRYVRG